MPAPTRRYFWQTSLAALSLLVSAPLRGASLRVSTGGSDVAIQGYDSHAYWTRAIPTKGADDFKVVYKGVPWHFVTQADADSFAADPARYAPQFGGFCTRAMSFKKVVDGDPEVWRIFEDRLYLFARPVGGRKFDGNEAAMIAKAQAHWDTLG